MRVGYGRTSTLDQKAGLEAQERDLRAAGCERLFMEQVSSVDMKERAKLAEALDFIREGDTLVVTKLDRLARSVAHLCEVTAQIEAKGASLRILAMNLDTGTATGQLMLNLLASVAEFERKIMLERQREGIAKAKARGRYKGRAPTAMRKADRIKELVATGHTKAEVARQLGISERSVYRALAE